MIDQPTARLMRKVAPPPADTLMRPRYTAPSSLPFTPCFLRIPILAHARPDGTRIQTARASRGTRIQVGTRLLTCCVSVARTALWTSRPFAACVGLCPVRVPRRGRSVGVRGDRPRWAWQRPSSPRQCQLPDRRGSGVGSHSHEMVTNHLPVGVRRIVAVFGVPSRRRWARRWAMGDGRWAMGDGRWAMSFTSPS